MTLSEAILHYFQGNKRYVAVWEKGDKAPQPYEVPVFLSPQQFEERHLSGKKCLGFYVMRPQDDTCVCSCVDFDNHDGTKPEAGDNARKVYQHLVSLGQSPILERSQSGTGYHVWLFHAPLKAKLVRDGWKGLLSELGLAQVEIYPRQDSVQSLDGRLGNFIRYPLWNLSQFEDASQKPQDALQTLQNVKMTHESFFESKAILGASGGLTEGIRRMYETEGLPSRVEYILESQPGSLLASRWQCDVSGMMGDKSRSTVAMAICTELVRYRTPTPEIEAALRYWCHIHNYEKSDRWITTTVASSYDYAMTQSLRSTEVPINTNIHDILHSQLDILAQGMPLMLPSGLKDVDADIGGICEIGEFCVLGARANSGKTAFSLEFIEASSRQGFPTVFYSLEMSPRAVSYRYLTRMGIQPQEIQQLNLKQLHEYVDEKMKGAAPVDFVAIYELDKLVESISEYAKRGYKLAVIDYMALIKTHIMRDEVKHYETIARELACASKKYDIGIVLLHQFGRDYEKRGGKPRMSDFKYAGEAEADCMLGLQYIHKENPSPENKTRMVIHYIKMRNRSVKVDSCYREVKFDPDTQRFSCLQF